MRYPEMDENDYRVELFLILLENQWAFCYIGSKVKSGYFLKELFIKL